MQQDDPPAQTAAPEVSIQKQKSLEGKDVAANASPTPKPDNQEDDIALLRQLHREINGLTRRTISKTTVDAIRPRKRSKPAGESKPKHPHPERTLSEAGSASDGDTLAPPKASVSSGACCTWCACT